MSGETPTPSEALERKVRLLGASLTSARQRYWAHPRAVVLFPSVLFRIYSEARATVRLLETAASCAKQRAGEGALSRGLSEYFEAHVEEERGHDIWALEALESLGFAQEETRRRMPAATVATMVGMQYYWMYHHHPVALLGYIKVVEHSPSTVDDLERMLQTTGLSRGALRLHFGHAAIEPAHNRELDALLDALPLTAAHEALIGVSAARTIHYVVCGIDEILALAEPSPPPHGHDAGASLL